METPIDNRGLITRIVSTTAVLRICHRYKLLHRSKREDQQFCALRMISTWRPRVTEQVIGGGCAPLDKNRHPAGVFSFGTDYIDRSKVLRMCANPTIFDQPILFKRLIIPIYTNCKFIRKLFNYSRIDLSAFLTMGYVTTDKQKRVDSYNQCKHGYQKIHYKLLFFLI